MVKIKVVNRKVTHKANNLKEDKIMNCSKKYRASNSIIAM